MLQAVILLIFYDHEYVKMLIFNIISNHIKNNKLLTSGFFNLKKYLKIKA